MKKAAVIPTGGNSFTIEFEDASTITLMAEDADLMADWVDTLEKIIKVATVREKIIRDKDNAARDRNHDDDDDKTIDEENEKNIPTFQAIERRLPTLRLKIDIDSIPPSSTQRHQFTELLISDLSKILKTDRSVFEVLAVKPFPGKIGTTIVEFEMNLYLDPKNQHEYENDEKEQQFDLMLDLQRKKLFNLLHDYLHDESSILFKGEITHLIDPTYSKHIMDYDEDPDIELFSPNNRVLSILKRYKDIQLTTEFINITFFTIYLTFESHTRALEVPNPLALPRRDCSISPFEVKQALGLVGTLQELWIEPLALIPKGMPKALSQPIVFEPSARLNDAVIIHASRLKAGLTYEVQCEDYRGEVLRSLSDEEMDSIKEIFDEYDANGDGSISKVEMEDLIRYRTEDRIDIINKKFDDLLSDVTLSKEDIQRAEEAKRQHMQHIDESKTRVIQMFDAADVNGDGMLSFTEFWLVSIVCYILFFMFV